MSVMFNEFDGFKCDWLRNLSDRELIAPGTIYERDIRDIAPSELMGFTQCHFFAGIGVWSYALREAGYSDSERVWTASCPCQPFSASGKRGGFDDERHLWPSLFWLIDQCKPDCIIGEQVASKDGFAWFDLVASDMEGIGYTIGAVDICAAGFGAPHIRNRFYWLAFPASIGRGRCASGGLVLPQGKGWQRQKQDRQLERGGFAKPGETSGFWADAEWLPCRDGKARPTQPGIFPLAHGATQRVGRLHAYGDAIVAPQAIEFCKAVREILI